MNEFGLRTTGDRGSIQSRRERLGLGSIFDWDPFRDFPTNANNLLGIDVRRTEGGYEIELPVPGFRKEELELTYQDGVVTVSGRNDRRSFTRSLSIPDDIDEEQIQANVEHGVLLLTLRQHPKRQPKKITIGTSAASREKLTTSTN